jgi:hypothetical protein
MANFIATLDRDALGVLLVATAGTLKATSAPIDVRATHDQAVWRLVATENQRQRSRGACCTRQRRVMR